MNLQNEAQHFLFSAHKAILSTHSVKFPGYPFGSVAPFVLDHQGMPILLISTLAEHTKNIMQNNQVSLIVFENEEDLQANARLTLLCKAEQSDKQNHLLRARYLRYFPQAEQYFDMHDFLFYTLHIVHARYIAGFGRMGWIDGESMMIPSNPLLFEEPSIIDHMNTDHAHNLRAYCKHMHQVETLTPEMIGIDSLGFDVRTEQEQTIRFRFETPISNAEEARKALVALARQCKT